MRSGKKKPFSNSRKRSKFKIINWPEYNNILRNRGRIDFMISNNLEKNWYEQNNNGKKRGGQRRYTDQAILVCLQIRCLFKLKLRQCQGFNDTPRSRATRYLTKKLQLFLLKSFVRSLARTLTFYIIT